LSASESALATEFPGGGLVIDTRPEPETIRSTIEAATRGEAAAGDELIQLLYSELRHVARGLLGRLPPGNTLQPTALVHEAYLRIADREPETWEGRKHFFAAAARAMRDILVDNARRKYALRRGGDRRRVEMDIEPAVIDLPFDDILALNEALERLERSDERKAQIVHLRYFAGLSVDETAALLGISSATVDREWRYVRVWLEREIDGRKQRDRGEPLE
jgi:RNA polymerase sigma factor (TIGR02999 family)